MILRPSVAALAAVFLLGAIAEPLLPRQDRLTSQIEQLNKVAFQGVLNNIGPKGSKAPGALAGIIIASPSTSDPNCKCVLVRLSLLRMLSVHR